MKMLQEFYPGHIWICTIPFNFLFVNIGTRMTVIKLSDGDLFLHSPVALTPELKRELDSLGRVRYVVSPNKMHHVYIGDYFDAYPQAKIYASPGLPEKRSDLDFKNVLTELQDLNWKSDLDQTVFLGNPDLREVVFFHRKSGTLIVADLIMNFCEESPFLTKLAAKVFGMYKKAVPSVDFKTSIQRPYEAKKSVEKILLWDFDKIIMAHGRVIRNNGKYIFKTAFYWLLEQQKG